MVSVRLAEAAPRNARVPRMPQHTWQLRTKPWQIQPMCIVPVLPGETMKSATFQARVVTDPIRNPLVGWWCEYYWFYVKHRDLDARDDFAAMMLELEKDMSAYKIGSVSQVFYSFNGAMDWVDLCLKRVTEEYFREEGEAYLEAVIDGIPLAGIGRQTWFDSLINDTELYTDEPTVEVQTGTPDFIKAGDMEEALRKWQFERFNQLTELSYEEWLSTYGVSVPLEEQLHVPELLRYVREWSYPVNTVEPTTGVPSSAVSWAIQERMDKARFFTEPGFIFGVSVVRPKIYFSGQTGAAVGLLDNARAWLPAIMEDDPYTSLRKVTAGTGPLPGITDDYWLDIRDLFMYGDQYINFALSADDASLVSRPNSSLIHRYVTEAIADDLFLDETADGLQFIRQDGVCNFVIHGRQMDHTPTTRQRGVPTP